MKTMEADVIVVAAGPAGLAAAITAGENDLKAIVFEKSNTTGGAANMGMGPLGIGTKYQKKAFCDITVDEALNKHMEYTHYRVDSDLVQTYFNKSADTIEWLEDMGVEFAGAFRYFRESEATWHIVKPENGVIGPRAAGPMVRAMTEKAKELGAEIYLETPATGLIMEDGKCVGVKAVDKNGEEIEARGKAVVVATGGFGTNKEMIKENFGYDLWENYFPFNVPGTTGDGLNMMWDAGAQKFGANIEMIYQLKDNMNWFLLDAVLRQPNLLINQNGDRFMNEGTWVQGKSMNVMHQTGNVAWSIFDADYGKYNRMSLENGTGGGMFWDTMSAAIGQEFTDDDVTSIVESDIAVGNTVKADSIEELAALIGAPADVLQETIDRYNELVTKGADDDFHKPADFLYPVVKAPFYAAKVGVALLAVVGGLSVNTDLQVLDDEKKPIEGLYATGNTSGDLYAIDYPINMAGNSNGRCVIWGYLLGKTMAKATASGEALTSRDELADLAKDENGIVASDTVYKDGSYTGTGKGRGGDMEVTVTITDGKISDIVVNSHAESSDIGAPALDKLIQNAIAANSAEIDGASGATMTSDGFREAVAQALAKAQ